MALAIDIGHFSLRGARDVNEDFAGAQAAPSHEASRGVVAAIADGVSGGGAGLEAAQTTVMSVIADYHAVPDTWDTTVVLDRLIVAQNAWLVDHNRRRQGARPDAAFGEGGAHGVAMTTLTAIALRGHSWTLAHVGDTRAWLIRGGVKGECSQLTHDHGFAQPDLRNRLTRAIGLDERIAIDYLQGELRQGDVLVLTTDGVHGVLPQRAIARLACGDSAQASSEALVREALAAGSRDNATALVIRVLDLDDGRFSDSAVARRAARPPPAKLKVGDRLDGHTITALVSRAGGHRLYQARVDATGELVAIKTLDESRGADATEARMLAHEEWLAERVQSIAAARDEAAFVRVRTPADASALYIAYDWHAGQTLEQMLEQRRHVPVDEVVHAVLTIARGLSRLHRLGVVHRDIKPANLHRGDDGTWRLLDLGVAVSGQEPKALRTLHAGTPSYMNPEQWRASGGHDEAPADAASDVFALGVTLYRWLTGRLPYGEVEPYQVARYRRDPQPPSRLRPDVPIWLDHVVLKLVALDPRQRFTTADELIVALERGAARPLRAPDATPLVGRDPNVLWKIALAISALFNALLVFWLLFLPR